MGRWICVGRGSALPDDREPPRIHKRASPTVCSYGSQRNARTSSECVCTCVLLPSFVAPLALTSDTRDTEVGTM